MRRLYQEILEEKKRIEFNMTEGEILTKLIHDAHNLSDETKQLFETLDNAIGTILGMLSQKFGKFVIESKDSNLDSLQAIGVDGSFQVIGGMGGIWYVPLSSVRIIFKGGVEGSVESKYFATVRQIKAIDESQAKKYSSYLMLLLESDEIERIANENFSNFYVFLDGPIIDPPFIEDNPYVLPNKYTQKRINAILGTLKNENRILGCVKRIRDRRLIEYLSSQFSKTSSKIDNLLNNFQNDLYLIATMFKHYRFSPNSGYTGPLSTILIPLRPSNEMENKYVKQGINIYYFFYQRDGRSPILRVEIATEGEIDNKEFKELLKALNYWILPGHGLPVPALLAHEKCTIREGCAQVLYEEIITEESTTSPIFNLWIR